jgi:hypothetical protein
MVEFVIVNFQLVRVREHIEHAGLWSDKFSKASRPKGYNRLPLYGPPR